MTNKEIDKQKPILGSIDSTSKEPSNWKGTGRILKGSLSWPFFGAQLVTLTNIAS